jgi:hypothetical protein
VVADGQIKAPQPAVGDGDPEIDLGRADGRPGQNGQENEDNGGLSHDVHLTIFLRISRAGEAAVGKIAAAWSPAGRSRYLA